MRQLFCLNLLLLLVISEATAQLDQANLQLEDADEIVEATGVLELINEEEARYSERKRITILNKESEANLFYIHYNPDNKILSLDADIFDMEGKPVRKVRKSEIRDVAAVDRVSIYTESRVKYIELNHSEYPYILEFSYSQRLKGISLASMPNWYFQESNTSAVTSSSYTVKVPQDMDIQYQMYNLDLTPKRGVDGNKNVYQWTARNLPAFSFEPYDPPFHRQVPILRITPSRFRINDYVGSMKTWQAYGQFLHQLWNDRAQVSPELSARIQEVTVSAETTAEKIALLYRFMQDNKRYVSVQLGIGGWQPFSADYVEEHGYGDCKALSNYMKAALQEIGVESYPAIIKAGGHHPYEIEDDFVDPAFNHAILYVPEEDMWLECTSSVNPPGYLGSFSNDRKVLLVTPEGGRLARTPKLSVAENVSNENLTVKLVGDGSAELTYEAIMRGSLHERWRRYEFGSSEEEIRNEVREKGKMPSLNLADVSISSEPDEPVSSLRFVATANRYASRAGKRLFVPLNVICPRTSAPDPVDDRNYPIVISSGYTQEATIRFQLPEGYRVESLPKPAQLETPFGRYDFTVEEVDGEVVVQRKFVLSDEEQPAESYDAFREFLQVVVKSDGSKMVLVSE